MNRTEIIAQSDFLCQHRPLDRLVVLVEGATLIAVTHHPIHGLHMHTGRSGETPGRKTNRGDSLGKRTLHKAPYTWIRVFARIGVDKACKMFHVKQTRSVQGAACGFSGERRRGKQTRT